jgi:hypothetical protein
VEHRYRLSLLGFALWIALAAQARVFMTQQQALASAFPSGAVVARQSFFLTPQELARATGSSGVDFEDQMIVRYAATVSGRPAGYAYFDTHRVRTLAETIMIVVSPEGNISRIEILSFDEPPEYLPRERWMAQFAGKGLSEELSLKRAIRPMSGATLSGRAVLEASRKILALHRVIAAR